MVIRGRVLPFNSLHSNRMLRNYLFKEFDIVSTPCEPEFCKVISSYVDKSSASESFPVIDNTLVIILSKSPGDSY